ncbi:putative beta-glucosidase L [Microthyrium microscopicum]|uniref:beta-glucosidase n=1 Tax=Microthyrium microscopicum TaxID=703497 RepID=A0A6A6UP74_9PEZI|nr:putative beta-glucosidase L [Microthyrium microscopicum]
MRSLTLYSLLSATVVSGSTVTRRDTSDTARDYSNLPNPKGISWTQAYARANASLALLSKDEKTGIVTGTGWQKGTCVGNTRAIPKIKYPSLCLQDGPVGIRYQKQVSVFPAGVHAASTWDVNLMYKRGYALGEEARGVGVHVQLGPVAGPLGKIPHGGRNWEGFSPDPYLTGIAMMETIMGMQEAGVQANAKHYIGNEQEVSRTTVTSNIDDRTMHELYLWPFADAVQANVASVMCSYNKLNGTWACENEKVLKGLLKSELEFKGYVMSDWDAQHTTVESANTGLDMTMPGSDFNGGNVYWGKTLASSVPGRVAESRLDDMVRRVLASWYYLGQDQGYPTTTVNSWKGGTGGPNVQKDHKDVARAVARDGIVLLKNDDNILPLKSPKSLAIIGQDAIVNPKGANACADRGCDDGTLAMGYGSGTAEYPYLSAPLDAIKLRSTKDGTKIITSTTDSTSSGASAAKQADIAIVFINSNAGEQYVKVDPNPEGDRINLDPWHNGNDLVSAVAKAGKPIIVVVHSVGPILLEKILALSNVKAIVWAGLPGQESGNSLADILYGDTAPNGKLPYTIAKTEADYGVQASQNKVDNFKEGIYIDYRHFDKAKIEPRYEFGFGLSYTTFDYANLTLSGDKNVKRDIQGPKPQSTLYASTGHRISATITNSGKVAGAEVPQLYLSFPTIGAVDFPPQQLRGFQKIFLKPGESKKVTFTLRNKDVSYWDIRSQDWSPVKGQVGVKIAGSSRLTGASRILNL